MNRRVLAATSGLLLLIAAAASGVLFGRTAQGARASGACPSGQCLPVGDLPGWHQVFTDDFTQAVSLGAFPNAVSSKWGAYPYPWPDTSHNGTYDPASGLSIHDGVLDIFLHFQDDHRVVEAPVPRIPGAPGSEGGLLYGRYAVRFKADPVPGYQAAWLLWPDSENWPQDGEIDFPDGDLSASISAYVHHQGASSGDDQDAFEPGTASFAQWHTAVIEWLPQSVGLYLDGSLVGRGTRHVPNTPMHWVLQTETRESGADAPSSSVTGHVYVDWVAVWTPV